jgi:hypothetical protein
VKAVKSDSGQKGSRVKAAPADQAPSKRRRRASPVHRPEPTNGGFLNRCRYVHQTAGNLGFPGDQPGKKFKVSFDDRDTSFLTGSHKCHPSQAVGYLILGCNSCEQTTG